MLSISLIFRTIVNMNTQIIKARSELYSNIRAFFSQKGYLEIETPTLSPDLIPEPTIDNFSTMFINEFRGSKELYMIPSPEIFMKKLIAQGSGSIFQISKCFRNCEQLGNVHNPEFSMLEYYSVGFDENDSILLTKEFLKNTALKNVPETVLAPWIEITVREAVLKYCNLDLDNLQSAKDLRNSARDLGLSVPDYEPWDDTFNRIFCNFVETSIPKNQPVLFKDYPSQIDCLAVKNGNYRRRWELYINGIEIANCYFEESNPSAVKNYYHKEYQKLIELRTNSDKVIPDCNSNYADYFSDFPKCSGVAIGLDRLLMVEAGESDINNVLLFPFSGF